MRARRDYSALRASPLRGRPEGRSTWLAAKLSNPLVVCRGFECPPTSFNTRLAFFGSLAKMRARRDSNPRPSASEFGRIIAPMYYQTRLARYFKDLADRR